MNSQFKADNVKSEVCILKEFTTNSLKKYKKIFLKKLTNSLLMNFRPKPIK